MAEGAGAMRGMNGSIPNWVRVLAFLVGTVGVPPLVIAFFLARDAGWIQSAYATERQMAAIARRAADHDAKLQAFVDRFTLSARVACENAATRPDGQVNRPAYQNCQQIR